ncbi:hypothetical protein Droror1_Dr00001404 [Drosera rotundifolia]
MSNEKHHHYQHEQLCCLSVFPHCLISSSSPRDHHHHVSKKSPHHQHQWRHWSFIVLRRRRHRRRGFLRFAAVLSFVVSIVVFLFSLLSSRVAPSPAGNESSDVVSRLNGNLWRTSSSELYHGCSAPSENFMTADAKTEPNRYLLISTSGGLNQQRTGIIDAVVAAYVLNATLVVPMLDQLSYWKDASNFEDIFDVDWFISFLTRDVRIIKRLPPARDNDLTPYRTRVPRKCTPECYERRVLPLLRSKHAVQLTKFDFRLSNSLETDLQKLRCRVNYHALRFTDPILEMGNKLLDRMRAKSRRFISLHLRFEPDMLAFSGCDYGGGEEERKEFNNIRRRWKTLHASDPEKNRRQGRCPLTPEEVGLMLRALHYGSDVHIYVASGDIYGGHKTLAPLRELFPNVHSKDTLMSKEELAPFVSYSSRLAALDFVVCDESDVFIANNNGNMARILAGRRRYFGHKLTIRPNAKKLYPLFMNRNSTTWEEFSSKVKTYLVGSMGRPNEVRAGVGEFHENPAACICECSSDNANGVSILGTDPIVSEDNFNEHPIRNDASHASDYRTTEDEHDPPELRYVESENGLHGVVLPGSTDTDSGVLRRRLLPDVRKTLLR